MNPMKSKVISLEQAAELIPDRAVMSVSSSSGLGCPDAMLRAIGERFNAHGHPTGITAIHPIAAGDMYGIKGIDHIAEDGLLARVIAGSYPSGPSSMESPKIWRMIYENRVQAYNVPSGVLFDMHRDAAAHRPGVFTKVGMDTFVDPNRQGCKMNEAATEDIVSRVDLGGESWLHFRNIPPNVALVRGTTADENGNISMEHEGAYLGVLDQALAAHNNGGIVIAQVKRVAEAGSIPTQSVHLPSTLVDYIVVDSEQRQTTETLYDPSLSGEIHVPLSTLEIIPFGTEKVIARRAACELGEGDVVNLGFGISALVPRVVLEESCHGSVNWAIEQGAVGGVPLGGFAFGCSMNPSAIMPSPHQFIFFQGGGMDLTMLSFMQVDVQGNVNVSRLAAKPHVTAGCGGFVDIITRVPRIVFCGTFTAGGLKTEYRDRRLSILQEGKVSKFVPEVEHVTFSGSEALRKHQDITYITERCVIKLLPEGLTVTEVVPGIDVQRDILDKAEISLHVSDELREMDAELLSDAPIGLGDRLTRES